MEERDGYRFEEELPQRQTQEERDLFVAPDDEVPFHVPRD